MAQRLETSAEARLRLPDSLRDGADPATLERVEMEDSIRLAEPERAEHDGLRLVAPPGHRPSLVLALAESVWPLGRCRNDGQDPCLHDAVVRLLRAGEGAARFEGPCVRRGQPR